MQSSSLSCPYSIPYHLVRLVACPVYHPIIPPVSQVQARPTVFPKLSRKYSAGIRQCVPRFELGVAMVQLFNWSMVGLPYQQ